MRHLLEKWASTFLVLEAGIILGIATVFTLTNGKWGVWDERSIIGMAVTWIAGITFLAIGIKKGGKG